MECLIRFIFNFHFSYMSEYDYVIIGSGFGGSVSALRLSEKGYKVLVIEKGKWFNNPEDFPTTNWNLRKWMWMPGLGMRGLFKMTLFRHVVALSGVGVGGGSLVYANTLPIPKSEFFNSGHWKGLDNWEDILKPYYETAKKNARRRDSSLHEQKRQSYVAIGKRNGYRKFF